MRRREFITLIGGVAAALPLAASAQQPDGMRRIAALIDTDESNSDGQTRVAALRQTLQQLGWTEGRNIQIELRWGGGDVEHTRGFAAELVRLAPDVIFAYAKAQLAPLARETRTIAIIFCGASAPVEDGFIASFAHPGGNITGFTQYEPSMVGKWLGALKEIAPALGRVAIVVRSDARRAISTASCVERSRPSFRFRRRPSSSSSSMPKLRKRSASSCRRRCSSVPTR